MTALSLLVNIRGNIAILEVCTWLDCMYMRCDLNFENDRLEGLDDVVSGLQICLCMLILCLVDCNRGDFITHKHSSFLKNSAYKLH